jgi:phenylalanyl-tRNA synthetase beta chain
MRTSLLPNLLDNIVANERFFEEIKIFEVGSVYLQGEKGEKISDKDGKFLPLQEKYINGIICAKGEVNPFYAVKNIAEIILKQLRFDYKLAKSQMVMPWGNLKRSLKIMISNKIVGIITELNPSVAKNFEIKNKVGIFSLNLTELTKFYNEEMIYQPIPKFPSIDLDISMIVSRKILWAEVRQAVNGIEKDLIKEVKIFDVFEGKGIPADKKSIAFRIEYRSDDKTLTMDEVQIIQQKVLKILAEKFNAQIRQ